MALASRQGSGASKAAALGACRSKAAALERAPFQSGRFGEGARAHSTFALVARANKMQVNDASALFSTLDLDVLALDSRAQV